MSNKSKSEPLPQDPEAALAAQAVNTEPITAEVRTFEDELAALAQQDAAKEVVGNPTIGTQGGVFTVDKAEVGEVLQLVVVGDVFLNQYYEGDFDPENPSSPVCYAYGRTGHEADDMFPHEESEHQQCENCKVCPKNQWGTADKGPGKACKNVRMLSVVSADDIGLKGEAKVYNLKVPVTSTNNFKVVVKKVAETFKLPIFGVVLEVRLARHKQHQFHMEFKPIGRVDNIDTLRYWMERRGKLVTDMMVPYPKNGDRVEKEAPKRSGKY